MEIYSEKRDCGEVYSGPDFLGNEDHVNMERLHNLHNLMVLTCMVEGKVMVENVTGTRVRKANPTRSIN